MAVPVLDSDLAIKSEGNEDISPTAGPSRLLSFEPPLSLDRFQPLLDSAENKEGVTQDSMEIERTKVEARSESPLPSLESSEELKSESISRSNSSEQEPRQLSSRNSANRSNGKGKAGSREGKKKFDASEAQLVWHFPEADAEAMATFSVLSTSTYQNRNLGLPRQQEDSFLCECRFDSTIDPPHAACGVGSNCINRLTQVECPENECRCGPFCQNQRITKQQISPFTLIKTEKKGFGVRMDRSLPADTFITEYIGEVIGHNNFAKRIRDYSDEGIKHFYFMALQKDEFIDATKKGGRARFLNHSCNPNCYVAKWVVGRRLRMGIFSKRAIQAGEELTFNYNVDRYGHEAQECFCGEPSCVGFIGGKTQSDIGIMDDLFLDALGIAEEVDRLELKGNKRKKGKKLDEDFMPVMRSITLEEVPKVVSAVRQAVNTKRILVKLLQRIQLTADTIVQSQLMRLRGFSMMAMVIEEHKDDVIQVIIPALHILMSWPLLTRNKLSNTNLESVVQRIADDPMNEDASDLAQRLLKAWSELELAYRIPRALDGIKDEGAKRALDSLTETLFGYHKRQRLDAALADALSFVNPAFIRPEASVLASEVKTESATLPTGWDSARREDGVVYYFHVASRQTRWNMPSQAEADAIDAAHKATQKVGNTDLSVIIQQAKDAIALAAPPTAVQLDDSVAIDVPELDILEKPKPKEHRRKSSKPVTKEKLVMQLISPIVIQVMTKHAKQTLDKEQFKKRAKELAQLLVDKECRSSTFESTSYDSLPESKEKKIRKFAKEWIHKLLERKAPDGDGLASTTPTK